jgi:hypothetical protein
MPLRYGSLERLYVQIDGAWKLITRTNWTVSFPCFVKLVRPLVQRFNNFEVVPENCWGF